MARLVRASLRWKTTRFKSQFLLSRGGNVKDYDVSPKIKSWGQSNCNFFGVWQKSRIDKETPPQKHTKTRFSLPLSLPSTPSFSPPFFDLPLRYRAIRNWSEIPEKLFKAPKRLKLIPRLEVFRGIRNLIGA